MIKRLIALFGVLFLTVAGMVTLASPASAYDNQAVKCVNHYNDTVQICSTIWSNNANSGPDVWVKKIQVRVNQGCNLLEPDYALEYQTLHLRDNLGYSKWRRDSFNVDGDDTSGPDCEKNWSNIDVKTGPNSNLEHYYKVRRDGLSDGWANWFHYFN